MEQLLHDLKHAVRQLKNSPGFSLTAIAALALGIGANTAIYSVVNQVLLKPLPYPEPDRLVQLMLSSPDGTSNYASIPKFNLWREQARVFDAVAAYDFGGPGINVSGGDRPEQVRGIRVSADYFRLFGAPVALGRTFTADEDRPGGGRVVVIGNGLWTRRYGADPLLIGKSILLGGEPYVVTGLLGPAFTPDPPADLWLPFQADPLSNDHGHYFRVAARLKSGVTLEMANAQLNVAAAQFRRLYPAFNPNQGFAAQPLRETVVKDVRPALLVLSGAVAFVLLIACANVANLLLARATGRRREMAIRAAIGAGRGRIIRQLLTESVLLAMIGGAAGLLLGTAGVRALLSMNPGDIPRIGPEGAGVTLDWSVFAFAMSLSGVTGVVFGLVPALSASRPDLSATLKDSGARSGAGLRQSKTRGLLVITEMALALVLLIGAALLIRTFVALRHVNPGFDPHHVLTMETSLTGTQFNRTVDVNRLVRQAIERIEAVPGVAAAAMTCSLPLEPSFGLPFTIEGRPLVDGPAHGGGSWRYSSPRYFEVFRIPIVRGRSFTERDDAAAGGVVLINQAMAKRYWTNQDPVGQRITIGKGMGPAFTEPPRQIIGIVADVRDEGLNQNPGPLMYIPTAQVLDAVMALNNRIIPIRWAVRTKGSPVALGPAVRKAFESVNSTVPLANLRSMDRVVGQSTARNDFNALLLTVFAGSALLLAAIGIYGLMAYTVRQRTQEIGIRIALGATPEALRNMVLMQGMRLAIAGVVIGLAAAFGLTRLIAGMLFGVAANDPAVFAGVAVLLSVVALLASYLPARRATRVDPITALRCE